MIDNYGRTITYLRLSVTQLCNLRCRYCMPADGVCKKSHDEMLTQEEMLWAVRASADLGVSKVRITGGEPLVKKNIVSICGQTAGVPGINEVCLTTNGIMLPRLAADLKQAGVKRINISLDTLNEEKYNYITRTGNLGQALAGLEAALDAGFDKVKINSVLIGGFNDDEIRSLAELTLAYPVDVRFIELMPMYDSGDFGADAYISGRKVLDMLPELTAADSAENRKAGHLSDFDMKMKPTAACSAGLYMRTGQPAADRGKQAGQEEHREHAENVGYRTEETNGGYEEHGVARLYKLPGAKGCVGLINPLSAHFCNECNRIRITADGKIKPCLHSNAEYSIKGMNEEEMRTQIKAAILSKPQWHGELSAQNRSMAGRNMNQIGG